ncbi:DEAD/DEAH box helicase [Dietzia sp.]|uniref:DEAD/DEAH box helicase n=1 Tax=Dietzia sp. TaxID=1871616 RepID=UPI002FD93100
MSSTFADLGVPSALVRVLDADGITTPTPIQSATLPDALAGRDVLGRGRTGSGKTYAFSIPLVARLAAGSKGRARKGAPRGLVLAPTRELARQIDETLAPLAEAAGLRTTVIFGGVPQGRQVTALGKGVDIVVACPGRLEDLMGQKHISLADVEVSVLDEADHMADLGFLPGVKRILGATPAGTQRLLFSATLDRGVDALVQRFLSDPVTHSVDDGSATPGATDHHVIRVDTGDRVRVISDLASSSPRTVVFTRTKRGARQLARKLTDFGTESVDLHGNLSQNARVRNLEAFSSGTAPVLVATDIAARGIHVDDVGLVIHSDPPAEHKAYVHRSGRTARAGSVGTVVTIATDGQVREVRSLLRAAGVEAAEQSVSTGKTVDLANSVAGRVLHEGESEAPAQGAGGGRNGGNGGRGRGGRGGQNQGGNRGGQGQGGSRGGRNRNAQERDGQNGDAGRRGNRAGNEQRRQDDRQQGGRQGNRQQGAGRGGRQNDERQSGRSRQGGDSRPPRGGATGARRRASRPQGSADAHGAR